MAMRAEGWLLCENCGHNVMPQDPDFKCTCPKCKQSPLDLLVTRLTDDPTPRSGIN
jgi:Zn finger protein HypA/HybF involved in hydrogenase expression